MRKLLIFCFILIARRLRAQDAKMNAFISNLMSKMTVDEKIGQLNLVTPGGAVTGSVVSKDVDEKIRQGKVGGLFGITGPDKVRQAQDIAVKHSRLHIPLMFGLDVIHGHKTVFPIPLGLSCTWDTALIEKSARIAATEASADGLDWAFSPMVDIARDPRWGRVSEGRGGSLSGIPDRRCHGAGLPGKGSHKKRCRDGLRKTFCIVWRCRRRAGNTIPLT